ncbi:MAG: NAD-dependent deacylase [Candidatus Freyarchaeota archaeon]|nr:NAD-dependent deacylase [Candidatus Jordarchaeia archaeon]
MLAEDEVVVKVARVLLESRYAVAFTGAGVSTESGIPDFRGPSGIWTKNPEAERRAYEVYDKFLRDPRAYWEDVLRGPSLMGDIWHAKPNPSHYALAELEKMGILKCVVTQNIDNLHQKAGSSNVIDFHGNVFKLRCVKCGERYERLNVDLKEVLSRGNMPRCDRCNYPLKSDVVYFGEPIPHDAYERSLEEVRKCDVMIVAGTSAVVYPAAYLPRFAKLKPNPAVIIEVNAQPTSLTEEVTDYFIQGMTGKILPRIADEVKRLAEKR